MPTIRYYDDAELIGLTADQLAHLRLVSRVLDTDYGECADVEQLEQLPDSELLALLGESEKPEKPEKQGKPINRVRVLPPRTLNEAFALIDGQLMRRHMAQISTTQDGIRSTRELEHLTPCGARARFDGRIYPAAILAHYLTTGELLPRVPRAAAPQRYRAMIRVAGKLVHLGYFPSPEERDTAIFAYRLGITRTGK